MERVFDRFSGWIKPDPGTRGGTGLGLSIAKQIVEAHGGSILLKSKLDKGTEGYIQPAPAKHLRECSDCSKN